MAKRSTDRSQLDLFAEPQGPRDWQEVPPSIFLSWPWPMQLKYCAERDRNSALALPENADWYLKRAAGYESDAAESIKSGHGP